MQENNEQTNIQLEEGSYEIIRRRLKNDCEDLKNRLTILNTDRKSVFGSIDRKLIANERVTTEHSCLAVDMVAVGNKFIFGYNVLFGLKTETVVKDVFSIYEFQNNSFKQSNSLLNNETFETEFRNLYKFFKISFIKFVVKGIHLYMVFQAGSTKNDIKAFKWIIKNDTLEYVDNRSDHEVTFPPQHEFVWERTTRDNHVQGKHPHVSVKDRVFVETIGGDLTIKIENNTETGQGIYAEDVVDKDQTLDDGEIYYAILGNLILLKIRPYQEREYRYFVFNEKLSEAHRIDSIEESCILLPDGQGIIFSNGYYLQNGQYKIFDSVSDRMLFEYKIISPNGEDFLYVFYNREKGIYTLLFYNLIEQKIDTPVICNGFLIFNDGKLCSFNANPEAQRHHTIQIWQTPFTHTDYELPLNNDSYLFKIGNKDIVRAMSECNEIINLIYREEIYTNLYIDLVNKTTRVIDSYYFLDKPDAQNLAEPLKSIKTTAISAIDEYEKVVKIKQNTKKETENTLKESNELIRKIKRSVFENINEFVVLLTELRKLNGKIISLKDLRYIDLSLVTDAENKLNDINIELSNNCTDFLFKPDALQPYQNKIKTLEQQISSVNKFIETNALETEIDAASAELEMLIEIVGNLKIKDATQTTRIIENISQLYSGFNSIKAKLKTKKKDLFVLEGKAEFGAQLKLINQSLINYADLAVTPEQCDEYLSKLMIILEELEVKFSEFDEFINEISLKREEIYEVFESKKLQLIEKLNQKTNTLQQSADRILKAINNKVQQFESIQEINGYFAADVMIEKLRSIIGDLTDLKDTVKADEIQSRLKTAKENAIRQLKDKTDLFVDGKNIIRFGNHLFSVNTYKPELTMVLRESDFYYHITGTGFFEKVVSPELEEFAKYKDMQIRSENQHIYRAEYLAYRYFSSITDLNSVRTAENNFLEEEIRKFMAVRYNEGYVRGVHDLDAAKICAILIQTHLEADLLKYPPESRVIAEFYWNYGISGTKKEYFLNQFKAFGILQKTFPFTINLNDLIEEVKSDLSDFYKDINLFDLFHLQNAAGYLLETLSKSDNFVIDYNTTQLHKRFFDFMRKHNLENEYKFSIAELDNNHVAQFRLIKQWLVAFLQSENSLTEAENIHELALVIQLDNLSKKRTITAKLKHEITGMLGNHPKTDGGKYLFDYNSFTTNIQRFDLFDSVGYDNFVALKSKLVRKFSTELRLSEFQPAILSSFVRNKLIDKLYLPLIGANLAKQIGTAGENKRTDQMGMLLLVSPPGYGKTTIMEYIASRLGIIFMKINGPAIGHSITSLDPMAANNAAAKEELNKLNLAFEMGDNVMIYLDDIQHLNPEFLQKFISLADAQRKIEGVYKGKTRTYNFRGKKVCVVMAGNPYTESGDKFQIPDMLANRADVYNLGDIIGGNKDEFLLSYIENAITSNSILAKLYSKSPEDIHVLLSMIANPNAITPVFQSGHSPEEIKDYINILTKLLKIRDVIARVNAEYIYSAAQQDQYRTEPPFKLQGSYRDMNKMTEKVHPLLNDSELDTLIMSHYENESQTLSANIEANILKFKHLFNKQTGKETERWNSILETYRKHQKMKGYGENNQAAQVIVQLESIAAGLQNIHHEIKKEE